MFNPKSYIPIILYLLHFNASSQGKTIKIFKYPIYNNTSFSASYVKYSNWKYQYSNMAFNIKEQLSFDTTKTNGLGLHARIYCELGFTKIIDSVWYTNSDIWELQYNWNLKEGSKNWNTSYGVYLTSQFLSRYEFITSPDDETKRQKQWQSGFFNPFQFEFSYGKTYSFWKICKINFSLAQIRISSQPIVGDRNSFTNDDKLFIVNDNTIIDSEYGFGIQTSIRKKINDHFRWENFSRFFGNAINPKRVSFDFKNSFIVNPMKHLMICFNTRLLYKPISKPFKVQQRYELMMGIEF